MPVGIQDNILTDLSKVADLKVISRTSVMQYRGTRQSMQQIASALHVSYLLEGSAQKANDRLRVSVQLINARIDAHVWADQCDRELSDVFAVQSGLAQKIASQLKANVTHAAASAIEKPPTQNMEAYDLYLRGKQLLNSESGNDLGQAVRLLEGAVARDDKFARAFALLSEANTTYFFYVDQAPASKTRSELALQTARELAPGSGEVFYAEALYLYFCKKDYAAALANWIKQRSCCRIALK